MSYKNESGRLRIIIENETVLREHQHDQSRIKVSA